MGVVYNFSHLGMCPDPDCLFINPLVTSIEVDFGLRCIPEESMQCRYNYTVDYLDPEEDNLLASETRGLTRMEINNTVFNIYPSSLRDGLDEFENGVIVVITVSLIDGGDITRNTSISGGMLYIISMIANFDYLTTKTYIHTN